MCRNIKTLTIQFLYLFLLPFAVSLFFPATADAAEGIIQFGSESYEWMTGDVCPIGFYIKSDAPISRYAVWLEYDSSVLTYLNGADRAEGNRIYLEGSGSDTVYKRMIHFEPLKEGDTSLTVVSAAAVGAETGPDGTVYETPVTVSEIHSSPIHILARSTRLKSLSCENAAGLEAFDPEIDRYDLQAEADVLELELLYETEDENAEVLISGLSLQEGKNIITLTVSCVGAEDSVYTLEVERQAAKSETAASVENSQEEDSPSITVSDEQETAPTKAPPEAVSVSNSEQNKAVSIPDISLIIGSILVVFLMLLYGLSRLREYCRKKERASIEDADFKLINLDQTVIDIRNVTMNFKIAQDESSSLKEYVIRSLKRQNHYRTLTALKNISFEINQGEVLGIIGTNGSGKSTLLKLISGALHPSNGEIAVDTSKVQMLTLGTGFDMELTAKENVYLNGAIIGYTREYIDEKYDEIVAFAELEGFMEERMKNFSSGMVSRLGFAIATMRDTPDILILDEVLSVGDMFFRKKSEKRIREMINSGSTVLIVSHSAGVIRKNCDRAVWIEKGILQMIGKPDEVCSAYEQMKTG